MKKIQKWLNFFYQPARVADLKKLRRYCFISWFAGTFLYAWNSAGNSRLDLFIRVFAALIFLQVMRSKKPGQITTSTILLLGFQTTALSAHDSKFFTYETLILIIFDFGILLRLHLESFNRKILIQSLRAALKSSLLALPFLAGLILLFNTVYHRRLETSSNQAETGISSFLRPGLIAELTTVSRTAYQIKTFPALDSTKAYYWRAAALSRGTGLNWDRPLAIGRGKEANHGKYISKIPDNCAVEQLIYSWEERNNQSIGLDIPVSESILGKWPSQVISNVCETTAGPLASQERTVFTATSAEITPKIRILVNQWIQESRSTADIVQHVLNFFKTEGFRYSLINEAKEHPVTLEEFLFVSRTGFCEHYAAASSSLMRTAGIPSRVVVGFLGGHYNPYGDFWSLAFKDAHAWSEIWIDGKWIRVDPTLIFWATPQPENIYPFLLQIQLKWEALHFWIQEISTREPIGILVISGILLLILSLAILFRDPKASLNKFLISYLPFRRDPKTRFEVNFSKLFKALETRILPKTPQEGYDDYRVKVLTTLNHTHFDLQQRNSFNEIFRLYQTLQYGNTSKRHISKDYTERLIQESVELRKLISMIGS